MAIGAAKNKSLGIGIEVKTFILHALQEVLRDPDFRLELTSKADRRLKQAVAYKGKTISLSEIKKKNF